MKFVVLYFTFQVVGGREPSCVNRMQESESHPPFVVPPNFSDSIGILTLIASQQLFDIWILHSISLHLPGGISTVDIQCLIGVFSV